MSQKDPIDRKLTLPLALEMLVTDGLIEQAQADALTAARRGHRQDVHPLSVIADQNWRTLTLPNKLLHVEALTEWMAKRTGLDYFHIDPLKIDFTSITDIMSSDYAARFGIMPVLVTPTEVVIATSEPYLREWESVIKPMLRKEIRRVVASPADISRYLVEI